MPACLSNIFGGLHSSNRITPLLSRWMNSAEDSSVKIKSECDYLLRKGGTAFFASILFNNTCRSVDYSLTDE
jgi:hypothetical protein